MANDGKDWMNSYEGRLKAWAKRIHEKTRHDVEDSFVPSRVWDGVDVANVVAFYAPLPSPMADDELAPPRPAPTVVPRPSLRAVTGVEVNERGFVTSFKLGPAEPIIGGGAGGSGGALRVRSGPSSPVEMPYEDIGGGAGTMGNGGGSGAGTDSKVYSIKAGKDECITCVSDAAKSAKSEVGYLRYKPGSLPGYVPARVGQTRSMSGTKHGWREFAILDIDNAAGVAGQMTVRWSDDRATSVECMSFVGDYVRGPKTDAEELEAATRLWLERVPEGCTATEWKRVVMGVNELWRSGGRYCAEGFRYGCVHAAAREYRIARGK